MTSFGRCTLGALARVDGVGLFTGAVVKVTMIQAYPGHGLTFRRVDPQGRREIPARIAHLSNRPAHAAFASLPPRSTGLAIDDVSVHTVEHVLSALVGMGITDAAVEVDGPEMPIADGSAHVFMSALERAGVLRWKTSVEAITLREAIAVEGPGGAIIKAEPAHTPWYEYHLDYGRDSAIRPQSASWDGTREAYARDIAPARTFCLLSEAMAMRGLGLFERFSPRDLLVIGPEGPIDNALRWENELARHKLLDLIGDLALAGGPIVARITARRSGHALNHEMARRLAALA